MHNVARVLLACPVKPATGRQTSAGLIFLIGNNLPQFPKKYNQRINKFAAKIAIYGGENGQNPDI